MAEQLPPSASEGKENTPMQIPLTWRIVAIVVAVIIIIALLSPQLRQRVSNLVSPPNSVETGNGFSVASEATTAKAGTSNPEIEAEDSPQALFEMGQEYYQSGRWEDAIAAYKKAVELDSTYQAGYVNLGDAYYQNQQLDLAVEAYQQALELNPDDAEVVYNLGATYLQQALATGQPQEADLEKALTQIEQAIKLQPELPHPYYALG
ncbi:MAG: tetratricopeptide repeat protein, partial [Aliifodinibius sp.]|nr:tetratricopeptide repeat protein [Fodinibius sp.]NIV16079.1 tetratricopeptide repeat protein [Fodinibius sp.]NIY30052.1 tetratricopeptide repeat protein [Fodinibius sp.]